MKKISILFITILCLSFWIACEKDETKAVLITTPAALTFSIPSTEMIMDKEKPTEIITFTGTSVDFGYDASITYSLQADFNDSSFNKPFVLATSQVDTFKFKVSELDSKLLTMGVIEDITTPVKIRVAASVLSSVPSVYSEVKIINFKLYGLPKFVLSTGTTQKIVSPDNDSLYSGFVWFAADESFTVTNFETGKVYGGSGGTISENGSAIEGKQGGWKFSLNLKDLTYKLEDATIAIVGDATGSWDNDQPMTYDLSDKTWNITLNLGAGFFKFRSRGGWGGTYNLGIGGDEYPQYTLDNLMNNGDIAGKDSKDIPLPSSGAGNYTVKLWVHSGPYKCKLKKN